ncbi:hypothetical protein SODG_006157 [Sodalis praecaptivus]
MIDWVMDSSHWLGEEGAITVIMQHVVFSVITLGLSLVIAFPVGCYVGHTGRGRVALVGMANELRALPSFGLIILLVILCGPLFESDLAFIVPCLVVLMVLALPPIMVGVYSGITAIDPAVIDAAIGIGYYPGADCCWSKFRARCRLFCPACAARCCKLFPPPPSPPMFPLVVWAG